jgi:hypothetical protein
MIDRMRFYRSSGGMSHPVPNDEKPGEGYDPDAWETPCPSPKSDGWHCEHWYDGDGCHWCGDRALTDAELVAQGSETR